jgi:thiazole synthase
VLMAQAFALATQAGRMGHLAGRGAVLDTAEASSPLTGFLS